MAVLTPAAPSGASGDSSCGSGGPSGFMPSLSVVAAGTAGGDVHDPTTPIHEPQSTDSPPLSARSRSVVLGATVIRSGGSGGGGSMSGLPSAAAAGGGGALLPGGPSTVVAGETMLPTDPGGVIPIDLCGGAGGVSSPHSGRARRAAGGGVGAAGSSGATVTSAPPRGGAADTELPASYPATGVLPQQGSAAQPQQQQLPPQRPRAQQQLPQQQQQQQQQTQKRTVLSPGGTPREVLHPLSGVSSTPVAPGPSGIADASLFSGVVRSVSSASSSADVPGAVPGGPGAPGGGNMRGRGGGGGGGSASAGGSSSRPGSEPSSSHPNSRGASPPVLPVPPVPAALSSHPRRPASSSLTAVGGTARGRTGSASSGSLSGGARCCSWWPGSRCCGRSSSCRGEISRFTGGAHFVSFDAFAAFTEWTSFRWRPSLSDPFPRGHSGGQALEVHRP